MSIHGECFDNGRAGRCDYDCTVYLAGDCDIHEEILKTLEDSDGIEQHFEIYPRKWEPTPEEIRECCGVWLHKNSYTVEIRPNNLSVYNSIEHFFSTTNLLSKLEPIPEQCIPKPEPERERYEWAGIVDEWM